MRVKIHQTFTPQSERIVKVKVASLSKKLDEKPKERRDMNLTDDGFDEIKDDLYTLIKNDEIESPFADDRSI
jgi:hypothetical protein